MINIKARIKDTQIKNLVSGDKSFRILLEGDKAGEQVDAIRELDRREPYTEFNISFEDKD